MVTLADMIVRHVVTAVVAEHMTLPHHPHQRLPVGAAVPLGVVDGFEFGLTGADPQTVDKEGSDSTCSLGAVQIQ